MKNTISYIVLAILCGVILTNAAMVQAGGTKSEVRGEIVIPSANPLTVPTTKSEFTLTDESKKGGTETKTLVNAEHKLYVDPSDTSDRTGDVFELVLITDSQDFPLARCNMTFHSTEIIIDDQNVIIHVIFTYKAGGRREVKPGAPDREEFFGDCDSDDLDGLVLAEAGDTIVILSVPGVGSSKVAMFDLDDDDSSSDDD